MMQGTKSNDRINVRSIRGLIIKSKNSEDDGYRFFNNNHGGRWKNLDILKK